MSHKYITGNMQINITFLALAFAAATATAIPTNRFLGEERIVNGTDVPPGKYPFMVSLKYRGTHNCGGTILNENWVLTAAHCIYNYLPEFNQIYEGSVDINVGGTLHNVSEFIVHELYDPFTIANDVGLARVTPPFSFDANTATVSLTEQGQETSGGLNATVIGWGKTGSGSAYPPAQILQEVHYWTVSDQECMDAHTNVVFDSNICAYYPGGGKGQCNGDSGGPLLVGGQQVGIVSWSIKPCTVAPYPGVFTEVSYFIDWINAHMY